MKKIIYSGGKYRGFTGFHTAEERSHFLCKWFTMFIVISFTVGTILLSFGMSLWNVYEGNYDSATWFLPYQIKLPIDKSTMSGWYFELLLQAYTGYAFVLTITSTVTFFGSCSFYIEAGLNQFKHMFMGIDNSVANEEDDKIAEKQIFEAIVFHNKVLSVFETVAEIYSAAIFFHLICNVLFFAAAIYQTEMVFAFLKCFSPFMCD